MNSTDTAQTLGTSPATNEWANTWVAADHAATCFCGCKRERSVKRQFAPGHDARMVSLITHRVVQGSDTEDIQARIDEMAKAIEVATSPALADKAHAAMMNAWDRAVNVKAESARKAHLRAAGQGKRHLAAVSDDFFQDGTVKIGRWTYPAQIGRVNGQDYMSINDQHDGSGDMLDAEGYAQRPASYYRPRFVPAS